ncbi:VOC family protein [Candidatus Symbiopectobacterium sp. NZEC151]|uniref:VOC family protein n=1 Tax=Candidatus Symbiopectobacterium sp. NZEC151 TaxID=2820470 RepID=UPI002226FF4C|nr:VOC family protein [Candidatus Symbiopectobacterium sp. NZEC151]MCW2473593.1 VOC family protein [Candidatus Symbiopectobacterium sp. NZEC151]
MLPPALQQDLARFECALLQLADTLALDLSQFEADHIALRCNQNTTAAQWKEALLTMGVLISENHINGRPICLFSLNEKITVGPLSIDCIELPWPGQRFYLNEGWEHVELVLAGNPETLHARALACLSDRALASPRITLKFSQPGSDKERLPNPTLAVSDGTTTIKFHPYSIREVIASERE